MVEIDGSKLDIKALTTKVSSTITNFTGALFAPPSINVDAESNKPKAIENNNNNKK